MFKFPEQPQWGLTLQGWEKLSETERQWVLGLFFPSKCGICSGEAETELPARTLLQIAQSPKSEGQCDQELRMSQQSPLKHKIISHALQIITDLLLWRELKATQGYFRCSLPSSISTFLVIATFPYLFVVFIKKLLGVEHLLGP